jgi:inosine-uridine nucleoside N-ribohydrolase
MKYRAGTTLLVAILTSYCVMNSQLLCTISSVCQNQRPLIIDHDAGVDDFIACTLQLLYCPERIKAITIAPADSYIVPACCVMKKLQRLLPPMSLQSLNIPIGIGLYEGKHPFPSMWRAQAWNLTELSVWGDKKISRQNVEDEFLHDNRSASSLEVLSIALKESAVPVDIIETGPCTNIAEVLTYYPELTKKIHRLYVMGGAVRVDGNVKEEPDKHDGSAEWNVYNNPEAFKKVVSSGVPITLISLDATQFTPIRQEFMKELERNCTQESFQFVFQCLMFIKSLIDSGQYMFWDTLTSAVAIDPTLVKTERVKINVVLEGGSEGRTFQDPDHGYEVELAVWADRDRFEKMVIDILAGKTRLLI